MGRRIRSNPFELIIFHGSKWYDIKNTFKELRPNCKLNICVYTYTYMHTTIHLFLGTVIFVESVNKTVGEFSDLIFPLIPSGGCFLVQCFIQNGSAWKFAFRTGYAREAQTVLEIDSRQQGASLLYISVCICTCTCKYGSNVNML